MLARPACSLAPHARPFCVLVRSARSSALRTRLLRVLAGPACSSAWRARPLRMLAAWRARPFRMLVRPTRSSAPHTCRRPHARAPRMLLRPATSVKGRPESRARGHPSASTTGSSRPASQCYRYAIMPSVALGRGSVRSQPRPTQKVSCRREGLVTPKKVEAYPTGARTARTLRCRAPG